MISILFWCIAAFLNAVMDTLAHHYYKSIFPRNRQLFNPLFWNGDVSWLNKYVGRVVSNGFIKWWIFDKPVFLTDGWHLCKTLMVVCLAISIVMFPIGLFNTWYAHVLIIVYGILWNTVFNVFYNHLLIKK